MIRVFINPRFAPYYLLASLIVSNQSEICVEAKSKKFAWTLGVILSLVMAFFIIYDTMSINKEKKCVAAKWAIGMGHEQMWKNHNCK